MFFDKHINRSLRPLPATLRSLWHFVRPYSRPMVVRCLIGGVWIAASLAFVWISKQLIDIATGLCVQPFWPMVALMVLILLVKVGAGQLASYAVERMAVRVQQDIRLRLFNRVMGGVWRGRERFHSGDTVNRLQEDISTLNELICTRLPDMVITACQLVSASVVLFMFSPRLMVVIVLLMLLFVVLSRVFFRVIRSLTGTVRSQDAAIQGFMQEHILNRALVLTFGGLSTTASRLRQLQQQAAGTRYVRINYNVAAHLLLALGFSTGYLVAFVWGVSGIRSGTVTYGVMTAFMQLVAQIQMPTVQLGRHVTAFVHALASVDRLSELEAVETEPAEAPCLMPGVAGIEVRDVSFSYPGAAHPVLAHFSCAFRPGTLTVVKGPTGAGKSTLVRLLLALLQPQQGALLLCDGARQVPLSPATRCNFMYVPQGHSLLSGTVRQNFRLARPDATDEDMCRALRHARAEFVLEHPDGLDMVCGEQGGGLSEGQAQRIALARALLHSGSVLLLDEATSALDADTERQVLDNLRLHYAGRKTIVFITHRMAVESMSDSVVVIEDLTEGLPAKRG